LRRGDFAVNRKCFSVERIVGVLKRAEVGVPLAGTDPEVGITEQNFYRQKKHYKGLETDQVRQLKKLQERMDRLKRWRDCAGQGDAAESAGKRL
jgi:putative transposase